MDLVVVVAGGGGGARWTVADPLAPNHSSECQAVPVRATPGQAARAAGFSAVLPTLPGHQTTAAARILSQLAGLYY